MQFASHPWFDRDLDEFLHKHRADKACFLYLQNLLAAHFETKLTSLSPSVLAPMEEYEGYVIYKTTMAVPKVHKNKCPRVAFARLKDGTSVVFLGFGTHTENYKTVELKAEAKKRLKEMLELNNQK